MQVDPQGLDCGCGRRGCFETVAGEQALVRYYARAAGRSLSPSAVGRRYAEGEPAAIAAVGEWLGWLARGVGTLLLLFDPRQLVLGGSVAALLPGLPELLSGTLRNNSISPSYAAEILPSAFGAGPGAVGGAALAYQHLFGLPGMVPGLITASQ